MHSGKEDCWSTAWHSIKNPLFCSQKVFKFRIFPKQAAGTFQNSTNIFLIKMRFQFVYWEVKTNCLNIASIKLIPQRVIYLAI